MHTFHGDLLIGGMAIRNLDGLLEEEEVDQNQWSGQFTVDSYQQEVLEIGRQYLLLLDDGRNREVVLTEMHASDGDGSVVCEFADCVCARVPK